MKPENPFTYTLIVAVVAVVTVIAIQGVMDAQAKPQAAITAGPYHDSGQYAGSLLLQTGDIVICTVTGNNLVCQAYGKEPALLLGSEINTDSKAIQVTGCQNTAWIVIQESKSVTTLAFELPAAVANCADPSRIFYPLVIGGPE